MPQACVYSLVFETPSSAQESKDSRIASPPHPFVIEPPLTTETHFQNGDSFDFQLLLFGQANDYLPYFIYAFEHMGKIGIGKRISGKRAHFILEEIKTQGNQIYSHKDQRLRNGVFCQNLSLHDTNIAPEGVGILRIIIETPLRLKFENRLKADLPFHVLVSPEFESSPHFYYPPRKSRTIELKDKKGQTFFKESRYAQVNLGDGPDAYQQGCNS